MCGIFGWSGNDPKKFNRDKFDKLGMYNTSRGKDSCGFTIDGLKYSGFGTSEKDYSDYIIKNGNKEVPTKVPIVIGHTRQASVGMAVAYHNIHPFGYGINKNLKFKVEDSEHFAYKMFFAHNGTLKNHFDLAKKYKIDSKMVINKVEYDKTDSRILGEIIFKTKNFNVLSEYIGAAACAFTDTETKTLYLFRGESKEYPGSTSMSDERPMYYYIENKNSLYFSSIAGALCSIGGVLDETVFELDANTVYEIVDGDISKATKYKIDRSQSSQKEPIINYNNAYNVGQGVQTSMLLNQNNSKYIFEKISLIPYELKAYPTDAYTKHCQSISYSTYTSYHRPLLINKGVFHITFSNPFTGVALNIENFGLLSLNHFKTLEDILDFVNKSEKDFYKEVNDLIINNLYFKTISNSGTEPAAGINCIDKFENFQTKNNISDKEVEELLKNKKFRSYFFALPKTLNFKENFINNIDYLTFIVDGMVVNNYSEFIILLKKCINSYKSEDYTKNTNLIFTKFLNYWDISQYMKYFVVSDREVYASTKDFKFYDAYCMELDEIVYVEGSSAVLKFEKGILNSRFYTKYTTDNCFVTDLYKKKNSGKLKPISSDIQEHYKKIIDTIKEDQKLKDPFSKIKTFDDFINLKYNEYSILKNKLFEITKIIDFDKKEDIKNFIENPLLNVLCNINESDQKEILNRYKIDEVLEINIIMTSIVNCFLHQDNINNLSDEDHLNLKMAQKTLDGLHNDLEQLENFIH